MQSCTSSSMRSDIDYSCYFVIQTDALAPNATFEDTLEQALKGGVGIVQLREKKASTREFLRLAQIAKALCDQYNVPFVVNDRLDIALAVGAGLHIGQDDLPLSEARKLLGQDALIGVSATSPDEAKEAVAGGANYLGIGPCFHTLSKSDLKTTIGPRGCAKILEAIHESSIPTVVIGGVHLHNVKRILHGSVSASGKSISGVAVVSAIASSKDPRQAAKELVTAVGRHHQLRSQEYKISFPDKHTLSENIRILFQTTCSKGGVIQNVTNTVVQNDCANVCLALKSSPIMSSEPREAAELGKILGALVINLGTLNEQQIEGMIATATEANANGTPLLLDPVGIGASKLRQTTAAKVLNAAQFTVIKGNSSEIGFLAAAKGVAARGVDSSGQLKDPASVVKHLAKQERCIVALTGKEDYVSDGTTVVKLSNGHPYLGSITGSGCMTGSAIGCFLSSARSIAEDDEVVALTKGAVLAATVAGIASVCIAGELAAAREDVQGPGTFRSALIDELARLDAKTLSSRLKAEVAGWN